MGQWFYIGLYRVTTNPLFRNHKAKSLIMTAGAMGSMPRFIINWAAIRENLSSRLPSK